jgi:ATP-binding protein involved in chromosome partitioning
VVTPEQVRSALDAVRDPEIRRPVTELGMVKEIRIAPDGAVTVGIFLTVSGCPLKDTITRDVTAAVAPLDGVTSVRVEMDVMSPEQRKGLQELLRGPGRVENEIPFAKPGSLTQVYAVASGKGGVGKSSLTVNLAVALAARGRSVGVVDADIYGHSVPRMLGVTARPTQVDQMIMPPQGPNGVRVISIGMFTPGNTAVVWRGPMLHRALQQFLADVYWGDLDVLLLDLPRAPGTSRSRWRSWCRRPSCWWSPPRSWRRRRWPSGPGRSRCRPTSRSSAWWRTCPGGSSRTAPGSTCSAPVAVRRWPSRCPR